MNARKTLRWNQQQALPAEISAWLIGAAILLYALRSMLFYGNSILRHDNLAWNYPPYHFWAESLANGHFPYWNPLSHGGEPFYMIPAHIRLLDPPAFLVLFVGKYITQNTVLLFNWTRIIESLVTLFGIYLVLRCFTTRMPVRLSLIPILLFSSAMLGSFQQDAVLCQFLWIPYITYFILRIVHDKSRAWRHWLLLGGAIGLNWSSYFLAGTWVFLLFLFLGMLCFRRDLIVDMMGDRRCIAKFAVFALIVLAMLAPNLALLKGQKDFVFPARMLDPSLRNGPALGQPQGHEGGPTGIVSSLHIDYRMIEITGTFSTMWDFLQMICPGGSSVLPWNHRWGSPSEAFIYLGIWPWILGIFGLFLGKDSLKRVWVVVWLGFALLMLGPAGGLHKMLYRLYPPVWFIRHTHVLVLFFEFSFLYFYVLGFNHLLKIVDDRLDKN